MSTGKAQYQVNDWLPTTRKELELRGWDSVDVILFSGDAYVDHPSFGAAVIGRLIEAEGFRVAVVPQPNWRDDLRDFKKLGKPRLFFGVTSGSMDSMVNHYTANKRLRSNDAYTPGGQSGFRPDYATEVYTQILKKLFPDTPVVIGGIEASLRRVTHYDYWSDQLRPGILATSGADMLVYGMGELPLLELLRRLQNGEAFATLTTIPQTAVARPVQEALTQVDDWNTVELVSHEGCLREAKRYAANFKIIEEESNKWKARRLVQQVARQRIIINPPYPPMATGQLNRSFDLPYTRLPHPKYHNKGAIPAFEMVKFSVTLHRGCFGGCSFCTISAHQGKFIASRSEESILNEVKQLTRMPDFKGYLSDLGGPSANMYRMTGKHLSICEKCKRPSCIHPKICPNLDTDHSALLNIYHKTDQVPGIKKSFIGSGIRYDLLMHDKATPEEQKSHRQYTRELIEKHVSGRLKVAPEHTSDTVLQLMRKPSYQLFDKFHQIFQKINREKQLNQQLVPYFISSHPGSRDVDMAELAIRSKEQGYQLEQVQDFTPTPMTLATVIYYSGYHPYTMEKVYTARTQDEKLSQRMFFFWYKPEFRRKIEQRLQQIGRSDLTARLFGRKAEKATNPKSKLHRRKQP